MNLLNLVSKASKIAGLVPGPGRKKRLAAALSGLLLVLLVKFGVPTEVAEALIAVIQAAAE